MLSNSIRLVSNQFVARSSMMMTMTPKFTRSMASCCGGGAKTPAMPPSASEIELDDFFKLDLRMARVTKAEHVEGAKKLLKLTLDLGPKKQVPVQATTDATTATPGTATATTTTAPIQESTSTTKPQPQQQERDIRTVFSGVKQHYQPEELEGKNLIVVANLKPKKTKFGMSEAMVLFASDEDSKNVLYTTVVDDRVQPGFKVL
ncbi:hypothetical protein SAMD00019534_092430 [Acytostelium subglobosum LB1]|uniref:hypothetical protein n=1 Tax=Acytostelium subglobosum LB1 TaxID=1410327 RepID=UPI0006448547|nr:hypothetical protein SAMD00019534_092430 [Acytostelium subglobosum LB1]GAM26068.1 hypothetical protein SAMD00019534_092430 [Acytostelium subglobosum LB1]|eukprot:XP_012751111.1 hypothetical protein SAMD00019534_092430 [Acytostelium subglobosum LB1]